MTILITAGPTREPLDPVRYLSNRSSGKMGYALAAAASAIGHRVLLISGPTNLDIPSGVDFVPVESAADMYQAVATRIGKCELAIFAAAVADYRPANFASDKIKKTDDVLTVDFVRNPDILGSARKEMGFEGILVGFAAETQNLEENARHKLTRKKCDFVVANDVSRRDIGFDSNDNEILLVYPDHSQPLPRDSKEHLAHHILEAALKLRPLPSS